MKGCIMDTADIMLDDALCLSHGLCTGAERMYRMRDAGTGARAMVEVATPLDLDGFREYGTGEVAVAIWPGESDFGRPAWAGRIKADQGFFGALMARLNEACGQL